MKFIVIFSANKRGTASIFTCYYSYWKWRYLQFIWFLFLVFHHFIIVNLEDFSTLDGITATERICPWRRSSIPDGAQSPSPTPASDPSSDGHSQSRQTDPHLHSSPLTSANFSGAHQKSPEYLGEYATTTKPEEHIERPNLRDLFNDPSKIPDEKQETDMKASPDESSSRL